MALRCERPMLAVWAVCEESVKRPGDLLATLEMPDAGKTGLDTNPPRFDQTCCDFLYVALGALLQRFGTRSVDVAVDDYRQQLRKQGQTDHQEGVECLSQIHLNFLFVM